MVLEGSPQRLGSENVTVYILDDHHEVRYQMVELVARASGMTVVGSSEDPGMALSEITLLRPRVAVLDRLTGVGDGLEVCRQLAASEADVRCVMTTSGIGDSWGPIEAAEAGAWAFLIKQLSNFPLVDVIGRVGSGERPLGRLTRVEFGSPLDAENRSRDLRL